MKTFSRKDTLGFLVLFLILVGNSVFLSYNAFRVFNFYDMGAFLDASWRVYRGQLPYVDFIYTTGPIHLYMSAFFFFLFGFGKTALWAHLIAVHSTVIGVTFLMMRRLVPFPVTLLTTLLTTPSFYWPISHPWYDQSAHFWGILGVGLLTHSFLDGEGRSPFRTGWLCGLLAVLSLMTKSNVGAAYGLVFFLVLVTVGERGRHILGFMAGVFMAAIVMALVLVSPLKYFEQTFMTYGRQAMNRLPQLSSVSVLFKNYYWVAVTVVGLNLLSHLRQCRKFLALSLLFFGVMGVGIFSIYTGSMVRSANIPLWGIHMALAFILLYRVKDLSGSPGYRILHQISVSGLVLLTAWLVVVSARYGEKLLVWRWIGRDPRGTYQIQAQPFRGWWVDTETGKSLDEIVKFFEKVPKNESLLVFSDLQILYSLTGRESYRGVPSLFSTHVDLIPLPGPQMEQVRSRILISPPDWIVDFAEETPVRPENEQVKDLPVFLGLEKFIKTSYVPAGRWGNYVVFKRKPA